MTNKLAIIGGSGLYDVEEFKDREFLEIKTLIVRFIQAIILNYQNNSSNTIKI